MNQPSSTPIKNKTALHPLSTYSRFRHGTVYTLGTEMASFFVGPMPVKDFLKKFLPKDKIPDRGSTSRSPTTRHFQKGCFDDTLKAEGEIAAYTPFVSQTVVWAAYASLIFCILPQITQIQQLVPGLLFIDSHNLGDKTSDFGFALKPDISVYSVSQGSHVEDSNDIERCIMSALDIHIEFKWNTSEDPFVVPSNPQEDCFIADTKNARDTLGQISAYAAAQLAAQYRTHAFSIFILLGTARIIRWDREGALVTEPIPYNDDPSLVQFLSLYSRAPFELRGIDTTVSRATNHEARVARRELGLRAGTQMLRTRLPRVTAPTEQPVDPVDPELSKFMTIVFPFSESKASQPACRATRACPAYDVERKHVVFFKDSWPVRAPDTELEGNIYERLHATQVKHIPLCLAHEEVGCWAEQETQTQKCSELSWACKEGVSIMGHSHYRLVLDLVGKRLSDFASSKELVQAIHDALIGRLLPIHDNQQLKDFYCPAHQQAYAAGVLHRDLSVGNIVIVNGGGLLIDWDLAKPTAVEGPRRVTRMVLLTFPFTFTSLMNISRALGISYLFAS
jgi:hypothetical protein